MVLTGFPVRLISSTECILPWLHNISTSEAERWNKAKKVDKGNYPESRNNNEYHTKVCIFITSLTEGILENAEIFYPLETIPQTFFYTAITWKQYIISKSSLLFNQLQRCRLSARGTSQWVGGCCLCRTNHVTGAWGIISQLCGNCMASTKAIKLYLAASSRTRLWMWKHILPSRNRITPWICTKCIIDQVNIFRGYNCVNVLYWLKELKNKIKTTN